MKLTLDITDKFARVIERACKPSTFEQETLRRLEIIMGRQEDFDTQITAANTALDAIAAAVAAEAQQIADFIAANPAVDTSALSGVVTRLEAADEAIGSVFTAPTGPVDPVDPVDPDAPVV